MCRLAIVLFLSFASVSFAKDDKLKEGTYYTLGQVGIKKAREKGGQLSIEFQPVDEQFYWCPGIKIKKTKKVTIVTFMRCKTSQNCSIDKPAKIGKRLARSLKVSTDGKDVFVRNSSNNYRRIYKSPKSELPDEITTGSSTQTKTVSGRGKGTNSKSGSGKKGNTRTLPLILLPSKIPSRTI